jgi:hypothetical protein
VTARLQGADGVDGSRVDITHDGLATLGGEGRFDGGGGVVEAPCEEGVVDELISTISMVVKGEGRFGNLQLPTPP